MSLPPGALVSVIVRTMSRPELARALDRVAAQTYRPLEIVLVDAAASREPVHEHRGVPVVFVRRGALDRPRAANAGLAAARGEAMMLNDEDDEMEPTHLADLVAALGTNRMARVAYSQSRLVDEAGNTARVFGGPFDRRALFRSNYLSSNAGLWERSLVAEGCRFDESFKIFEDWDFWLQCAMRTAFAFTGRPTAIYHGIEGRSGAGAGPNRDRERLLAQRERLMRKWERAIRSLELASDS
jgi:glycosyltransferase involved in cell wall biosynthesis